MQITLEVVRQTHRQALGHDSFVAAFIKTVEAATVPTAAISADGTLRYNPDFVGKYIACEEDLFCWSCMKSCIPCLDTYQERPDRESCRRYGY